MPASDRMRTAIIAHREERLNSVALVRWLQSFSTVSGVVLLEEPRSRTLRRIKRELDRVGFMRFLDVLAFRAYHAIVLARGERDWEGRTLDHLLSLYPVRQTAVPEIIVPTPNSPVVEKFLREAEPDILLARCKVILNRRVLEIPQSGTIVMHPGICPEYRNAHGCFWALARRDLDRVGLTVLRADPGVDTGPVLAYLSYPFDELNESPFVIQDKMVTENLDQLRDVIQNFYHGRASAIDTSGRESRAWGQPWLSAYLRWRSQVRGRQRAGR